MPCRRSRVRIPSAALEKACICRSFCWSSSPCSSASGRTDSGLAAGQSPAASRKTPGCRPILVRPNRSPSAGLQKVEGSPAAAVTPTPAATARSCGQRPPARYQRSRSLGPVRFQSGNREVHLGPLRDPPCHLEPCVSPHGPEAAARCPTTRGLSPGSHTGSSPTCRFPSGKQASAPTRSGLLLIVRSGRQPDGARECSLKAKAKAGLPGARKVWAVKVTDMAPFAAHTRVRGRTGRARASRELRQPVPHQRKTPVACLLLQRVRRCGRRSLVPAAGSVRARPAVR